jgi:hypothetical protein
MAPEVTSPDLSLHGPLAAFVGTWEGAVGDDTAPGPDLNVARSAFRERMVITSIGRVDNHAQVLYGLAYSKRAWRLGAADAFHEETGYLLWDAARGQVIKSFIVPRGIAVIAGGAVAADATTFTLAATLGSTTYGVLSNQFLDAEFRTTAYQVTYTATGDTLRYDETTTLVMPSKAEPFLHRDVNTLTRVA